MSLAVLDLYRCCIILVSQFNWPCYVKVKNLTFDTSTGQYRFSKKNYRHLHKWSLTFLHANALVAFPGPSSTSNTNPLTLHYLLCDCPSLHFAKSERRQWKVWICLTVFLCRLLMTRLLFEEWQRETTLLLAQRNFHKRNIFCGGKYFIQIKEKMTKTNK